MLYLLEVLMSIDILIVDTPTEILSKLVILFKDHCSWFVSSNLVLIIKHAATFSDTTTYSSLSEDDLATLEFLPDFDTRYTYLLSLSLGIDA